MVCTLVVGLVPADERPVVREVLADRVGGFVAPVPGLTDGLAGVAPVVDPPVAPLVAADPAGVLDVEMVFFVVVPAVDRVVGAGALVGAGLLPVLGLGRPSAELADPLGAPAGAETGAGATPTVPAPADEGLHPATASKQMAAPTTSPGIARCCANTWWRIPLLDNLGTDGRRKHTRRAREDRFVDGDGGPPPAAEPRAGAPQLPRSDVPAAGHRSVSGSAC